MIYMCIHFQLNKNDSRPVRVYPNLALSSNVSDITCCYCIFSDLLLSHHCAINIVLLNNFMFKKCSNKFLCAGFFMSSTAALL